MADMNSIINEIKCLDEYTKAMRTVYEQKGLREDLDNLLMHINNLKVWAGIDVEASENTLPIQRVMPRTSQNDYITLCKPNYLAKDGSIKMAREIVNDIGEIIRWEALKSDMYGA